MYEGVQAEPETVHANLHAAKQAAKRSASSHGGCGEHVLSKAKCPL